MDEFLLERADEGEIAVVPLVIEPVTHDEFIADFKAHVVRLDRDLARAAFFQQHAEADAGRPAFFFEAQTDRIQRDAAVEDVIDDQDMPPAHLGHGGLVKGQQARALRAAVVAGNAEAAELQREVDAAQQIGGKEDAAVQNKNHGQLLARIVARELAAYLIEAAEDGRFVEKNCVEMRVHGGPMPSKVHQPFAQAEIAPMTTPSDPRPLADLRVDYALASLDEGDVLPDALAQFRKWFGEAQAAQLTEPNAMVLATISPDGHPSTRTVLLKDLDARGFTFFTNYDSRKARDLAANPRASATFLWLDLQRQAHVSGVVEKVAVADSESYFQTRPYLSQLGAHASTQSAVIPSRAWLQERFDALAAQFPEGHVPLPDNWGGCRLVPDCIEFWQGRRSRLHDRIRYTRSPADGLWKIERLSP